MGETKEFFREGWLHPATDVYVRHGEPNEQGELPILGSVTRESDAWVARLAGKKYPLGFDVKLHECMDIVEDALRESQEG
jgi:hypothetical protein